MQEMYERTLCAMKEMYERTLCAMQEMYERTLCAMQEVYERTLCAMKEIGHGVASYRRDRPRGGLSQEQSTTGWPFTRAINHGHQPQASTTSIIHRATKAPHTSLRRNSFGR